MAYTIKASGIATNLLMCLAIDEDGTTIKEFISSDVNSNKTTTGVTVGASTWKGTSRGYFQTSGTSGSPNSVQFPSGHRPAWDVRGPGAGAFDGGALFVAFAGSSASGGNYFFVIDDAGVATLGVSTTLILQNGGGGRVGATTIPADGTTKFSAGANYAAFTDWQIYYGLESGSLAQDATGVDAGTATIINLTGVGGWTGFGVAPAKFHIAALFNRSLTLVEMQSLHNDWFGTLFDVTATAVTLNSRKLLLGVGA